MNQHSSQNHLICHGISTTMLHAAQNPELADGGGDGRHRMRYTLNSH